MITAKGRARWKFYDRYCSYTFYLEYNFDENDYEYQQNFYYE